MIWARMIVVLRAEERLIERDKPRDSSRDRGFSQESVSNLNNRHPKGRMSGCKGAKQIGLHGETELICEPVSRHSERHARPFAQLP